MSFLKFIILVLLAMALTIVSSLITVAIINRTRDKSRGLRSKEAEVKIRLSFAISKYFSADDLEVLYDEMSIEDRRIVSSRDVKKIMGLINHCQKVGRVGELIELVEELRPAIKDELWLLKGDIYDALIVSNRVKRIVWFM